MLTSFSYNLDLRSIAKGNKNLENNWAWESVLSVVIILMDNYIPLYKTIAVANVSTLDLAGLGKATS